MEDKEVHWSMERNSLDDNARSIMDAVGLEGQHRQSRVACGVLTTLEAANMTPTDIYFIGIRMALICSVFEDNPSKNELWSRMINMACAHYRDIADYADACVALKKAGGKLDG